MEKKIIIYLNDEKNTEIVLSDDKNSYIKLTKKMEDNNSCIVIRQKDADFIIPKTSIKWIGSYDLSLKEGQK